MKYNVFIDGKDGTTGLKIHEYFSHRDDISVIDIDADKRKDPEERARLINSADVSFLCLPDVASREIVQYISPDARVLDTSTAHRTSPDWVYGFPELEKGQRERVASAARVAVPGCHATGFIALAKPLTALGICAPDYPFCAHSVTGYSGGGKKMIAEYEDDARPEEFDSPRQYALAQQHKHLPEMTALCGLTEPPVFDPIVSDYYSGMLVTIPLTARLLAKKMTVADIRDAFREYYAGEKLVRVMNEEDASGGFLASNTLSGKNSLEIFVYGNDDRIMLSSRFDNLGKGASGAAVQCMNIMLGIDETKGLV